MSLEIWKSVVGYENYSVSSWGRVKNNITGDMLRQEVHDKERLKKRL